MIRKIVRFLPVFLFFLGICLSFKYLDRSLFSISDFDRQIIQENDTYLMESELGFFFRQKLSRLVMGKRMFFFNRFLEKIAYPLDFKPYLGKQRFLVYISLPFFFVGFFYLVSFFLSEVLFYVFLAMFLGVLLLPGWSLFLYLPMIIFSSILGFYLFLRFARSFLRLRL